MSEPTEMWPMPPEQEARAQAKMEASDVPAYDWPGAVAACVKLTKRGWLAHTRLVGPGDRWVVEARRKSWPADQWRTLCRDGRVH